MPPWESMPALPAWTFYARSSESGVRGSMNLKGKGRRHDAAAVAELEEQAPGAGDRQQHADVELSGPGRAAGDLRAAEHARAAGRRGSADVRVEVVERALPEEDRVGERPVPRVEDDRLAARVCH